MPKKGITAIKGGFLARHYWGKSQPIQEYFYNREYDNDPRKAEQAAEHWLERIAKEFPAPVSKGRKPIIGNTKDGYSEKSAGFYVAWTTDDGIQHKKEFPYAEYGSIERAKKEAERFLKARTKEYKDGN